MFKRKLLDELAAKLCQALPTNVQAFEQEIKQQFHAILQSAFASMDIVTREEFDVQVKVLARTREKIESLQAQIYALEEKKARS